MIKDVIMKSKVLLFIALLASFHMANATTYECKSSYNLKVDSTYVSTYPDSCTSVLARMKDGYFCQGLHSVYNTNIFKNVNLHLPSGKDCEDILNEMVDDKYCAGRYDIGSLITGAVSYSHGGTCESVLYGY